MQEIFTDSSIDGSREPSLFFLPENNQPDAGFPLLVGLHTWSHDRFNQVDRMLPFCMERGWALLLPEFRGPNLTSNPRCRLAAGSILAGQDVFDAVQMVLSKFPIDRSKLFLLGGSGGGMMALLLAGRKPDFFSAVSAWCPITDLERWHVENQAYLPHVEACCGGAPSDSNREEYNVRSAIFHAETLRRVRLCIHHGRHDPVVPYTHSLRIAQKIGFDKAPDFFFELFDGGHELRYSRAFNWFDSFQTNDKSSALSG